MRLARKNKQPQSIVSLDLRLRLSLRKITLIIAHNVHMLNPPLLGDGIIVTRHVGTPTDLVLGDYSTTEQATRYKWIDGKTVYRKVVDLGNLPNSTKKSVTHGINMDYCISLVGIAATGGGAGFNTLPMVSTSVSNQIILALTSTTVDVTTGSDRSSWTGVAVLEYTKN